jgi:LysR family transcriptional regulator, hydrogen peroxide-inducible genes activator
MEMHQIRCFLVLCETLNFTRAAERCNVSQPSLTRAIRLLESGLGGLLFNRERGNTHLTELGSAMKPHLGEVMAQARLARTRASALFALKLARLKLGLSRGVALQHVHATLSRFAAMYPDTEITLLDDGAGPLREALRRGDVEIAVLPDRPHDIDDLHYHAIGADRVQLQVRPDHRLAAFAAVRLDGLSSETLIACDGCPFFAAIKQRLAEDRQPVRPGITVGAAGWLPTLAAAGLGVAVTGLRFGAPPGLVGRAVAELPGSRDAHLATKRGRLYSPPVKAFLDLVLKSKRQPLEAGAA